MNQYQIGSLIKEFREKKNYSQASFANLLGVSDKAVSKWETGKSYPDITLLGDIAKELQISVEELLAGNAVRNVNVSANMLHAKFYVCPVCGNVIYSMGEASINCHGVSLCPLQKEEADEEHSLEVSKVEDEYYVTMQHPMGKEHYISFVAAVSSDRIQLQKFYPEGNVECRFKMNGVKELVFYCNQNGLFVQKVNLKTAKKERDFTEMNQEKAEAYQKIAKERWGETKAYQEFEEKNQKKTNVERRKNSEDMMNLFFEFGEMKNLNPADEEVQNQVKKLQDFITKNYYTCTNTILSSLGQMYVAGDEMTTNINVAGGEGCAEFVKQAIDVFCR